MCGIWAYLSKPDGDEVSPQLLYREFSKLQQRGPDRSSFQQINSFLKIFMGFHRLAIMDLSTNGDQPFIVETDEKTTYCLCNGEIYNYKVIAEKYNLKLGSHSDCEVIPHLYLKEGMGCLVQEIQDSEFAVIIIEVYHDDPLQPRINLKVARDPCGVRPLFIGEDANGMCISSELKGIVQVVQPSCIMQYPPGSWMELSITKNSHAWHPKINEYFPLERFHHADVKSVKSVNIKDVLKSIKEGLITAVESMLHSERPLGALLSGGLDSSLVVAIAARRLHQQGRTLNTFSIGMPGGTDEKYARLVAQHCRTNHTHIELSKDQFLSSIHKVVWTIESPDITTVRASVGQVLAGEWIRNNTGIKVLLIGDGSDELTSGYKYFHKAPSAIQSHQENVRLLRDICYFDVLRADRGVAGNGLEARVPFLQSSFVKLYLSIDLDLRMATYKGLEKGLLREAFDDGEYLPHEVLYRHKEAFSDGVSSKDKSWYQIIQDRVEGIYTKNDLKMAKIKYPHLTPTTKEGLYYREIFEDKFNGASQVIPYFWMPKWCGNVGDPSARVLDVYN